MPDEMAPAGPIDQGPNKKTIIIVLTVVVLLLIGGAIWYFFSGSAPVPNPSPSPSPSPSPLPQSETIKFQGYANSKYGYSLEYPNNWFLNSDTAQKDLVNNAGADLFISNKQNYAALASSNNPPSDLIVMGLTIYQPGASKTVDQFIKDQKYPSSGSEPSLTINGLSAKQLVNVVTRADKKNALNITTIIKKDTKMFVFSYNSFMSDKSKLPSEVVAIHDEIINSFKIQ